MPAATLLLLVIDVEVTAPVALTLAAALVPLIPATVAVPAPAAPLLFVTVALFVDDWLMAPKVSVAPLVPMALEDTEDAAPVAEIEAEEPAPSAVVAPRLPTLNVVEVLATVPPVSFKAVCEIAPVVVDTLEFAATVLAMLPFEFDPTETTAPVDETPTDVPLPVDRPPLSGPIGMLV